jgi:hypothetical protein
MGRKLAYLSAKHWKFRVVGLNAFPEMLAYRRAYGLTVTVITAFTLGLKNRACRWRIPKSA